MSVAKLTSDILREHKGISFVGISTVFFVYDDHGHFVMAKRSQNARDEQGTWEIGGGGLKWGQKAEENIKREMEEEYGAKAKDVQFLGYRDILRVQPDGTKTHWVGLDFAVKVNHDEVKNNEPESIEDVNWFTADKLPSPLHSQFTTFMDKYKNEVALLLGT